MRRKSKKLRANPKRGIGFEEAQAIFSAPYYLDHRNDMPVQHRAIGWGAATWEERALYEDNA